MMSITTQTENGQEYFYTWHVGEKFPIYASQLRYVVEMQADYDELDEIGVNFTTLVPLDKTFCRYYGDIAKMICSIFVQTSTKMATKAPSSTVEQGSHKAQVLGSIPKGPKLKQCFITF